MLNFNYFHYYCYERKKKQQKGPNLNKRKKLYKQGIIFNDSHIHSLPIHSHIIIHSFK